ncbi:MAG: hypothetical protein ACPGVT_04875 [Maricaulaceae bacterium]
MAPKGLILQCLAQTLHEPLAEHGFKFLKSIYKRNLNGFTQTIQFQLNRHNMGHEIVDFWISNVTTTSKLYQKWKLETFGADAFDGGVTDYVFGKASWNLPAWDGDHHFDIGGTANKTQVLDRLKQNVTDAVILFLDSSSTWQGLAECIDGFGEFLPSSVIVDTYYLAGQKDKALQALLDHQAYFIDFKEHVNRDEALTLLAKKEAVLFK